VSDPRDLLFKDIPVSSGDVLFGVAGPGDPRDLVFKDAPVTRGNLVFGQTDSIQTDASAVITGTFPALTVAISAKQSTLVNIAGSFAPLAVSAMAHRGRQATVNGTFAPLTASGIVCNAVTATVTASFAPLMVAVDMPYDVRVERPLVGQVNSDWQKGTRLVDGALHTEQVAAVFPLGWKHYTHSAPHVANGVTDTLSGTLAQGGVQLGLPIQEGTGLNYGPTSGVQDADRVVRVSNLGRFSEGVDIRNWSKQLFQDGGRGSRGAPKTYYQEAKKFLVRDHKDVHKSASHITVGRNARHQDAMVPPPGKHPAVVIPITPPYSHGNDLVFKAAWSSSGHLVFASDTTTPVDPPVGQVVVPIRSLYVILNTATLRRVSDNALIPTFGMSLSLDAASWTWGFGATLPGDALDMIMSNNPVEVEATINGVPYRAVIEQVRRSREFGKSTVSVSGRGRNALLDAPYAPQQVFSSADPLTAQQLAASVLTLNGVSMGWAVAWGLEDWNVPGGVFNHQGTYITALNAIAGAAGGYIQPHNTAQTLRVLPRYPVAPWDLIAADYELPSAVTTSESIEWITKPEYNRVYVSGTSDGVLGQITREGTAGDLLAPMVTDALITDATVARQRATSILADTGRMANVQLKLPVLPETGIILPGKTVLYTDQGTNKIGYVRSVNVDIGLPEIWQTIGVETHV
jgi:hypothetical protein